jgi:hypothetical protein
MANKSKDLGKAFIENVWGKREKGLPISRIDWNGPIKHEDVLYLLGRYPFLQIISTDPNFTADTEPKFISAHTGWTIHDYGDAMSTSLGPLLFGNYSEEDGESGSGSTELNAGKGTVVNQAVMTAQEMIALAIQKGWPGVEIIAGTSLMQWAAWMMAEDNKLTVTGFEPTEKDKQKRERIRQLISEITKGSTPGLTR